MLICIGRPPGRSCGKAKGFSLIELMVTLTLLGILLSVGLPAFSAWIANSQVRTVAESLQTGLRTAQTEAVRRNRQVVLAFTDAAPAAGAAAVAGGKNWTLQTVGQFGETAEYIQGGSLSDGASTVSISATPSANALCFNSNGRLTANAMGTGVADAVCAAAATSFTITRTGADRNLRVDVTISGQMRMCDPKRTRSSTSPDGC